MEIKFADRKLVAEREILRLAGQLIQRINDLERRLGDLEERVTEVVEDLTVETHDGESSEEGVRDTNQWGTLFRTRGDNGRYDAEKQGGSI